MPNIVGRRYLWFAISLLLIIPGIVAMIYMQVDSCAKQARGESTFCAPLRLSIDYTGGTLWELSNFQKDVQPGDIREVLLANGLSDVAVQTSDLGGEKGVLIRTVPLTGDDNKAVKSQLEAALRAEFGDFRELRFESVGPVIGQEITERSQWAVLAATIGVLLYVTFAFRGVTNSLRYGVCAIIANLHDVLIVLGLFAILGIFFSVEVDALFLTAVLTILGFSTHDTIVVLDRIRENRRKYPSEPLEKVVNFSIFQTLDRSINTNLTVLFTLTALFLFGGGTIRTFVGALLVGMFSGTYSSIFIASPLLVAWENRDIPRFFARLTGRKQVEASRA